MLIHDYFMMNGTPQVDIMCFYIHTWRVHAYGGRTTTKATDSSSVATTDGIGVYTQIIADASTLLPTAT